MCYRPRVYDEGMHSVSPAPTILEYRGQDSDFDDLMNVPIRRFSSMDDLLFDLSSPARYIVADPQYTLPVDVLFYPRDKSRLLVGFHGAENRAAANFPKFQFVRSFLSRKESLLFVSDSTLLQGEKINIGWLAGNKSTPLASLISAVVRRAGEALGVSETVLAGHSAGGYSAILVGSQVPNSRAISVSGQSVVERYEPWTVRNLHLEAFPECSSQAEMVDTYPTRLDLRVALRHRLPSSSFSYFGNVRDKSTFSSLPHFPLLAESFGLTPAGGLTAHGDAFIATDWGTSDDTGHALPGSILPFIQLVLDEEPTLSIPCTTDPRWRRPGVEMSAVRADAAKGDKGMVDSASLPMTPKDTGMLAGMDKELKAETTEQVAKLSRQDDEEARQLYEKYADVDYSQAEADGSQISR